MSNMKFEDSVRKTYARGGLNLVAYALDRAVNEDDISHFNLMDASQEQIAGIGQNGLKEIIAELYIKKIIDSYSKNHPKMSLHFENMHPVFTRQNYSFLDRAIIMTYYKYQKLYNAQKSDANGLDVAKSCLLRALEKDDNRFTRDVDTQGISARNYAASYFQSMIDNNPSTWKKDIYRQLVYDVSLDLEEKIVEQNIEEQRLKLHAQRNNPQQESTQNSSKPTFVNKVKSFFPNNFEKVKSILQSGLANSIKHSEGHLKGMYYCQDMGKVRKNQEDALLIMENPNTKGLRLAIVSDGMGGGENGELASNIVVDGLRTWFESKKIPDEKFITPQLVQELEQKIYELSSKINQMCGNHAGATLTGAIIGKDKALIMNVGDSRTYAVKNGMLNQLTVDHSIAHFDYMTKFRHMIPGMTEDEMRFAMNSNIITRYVGAKEKEKAKPDFKEINVKDFDQLVLCSDGVSDCMGFNDIATCIRTSKTKDLANRLVEFATTTVSVNPRKIQGFKETVDAGKDNTTAVVVDLNER